MRVFKRVKDYIEELFHKDMGIYRRQQVAFYAKRWTPWVFIPLLVVAIICVALFTNLSAETQASIWVAVGTLALALVTYWSVSQTSAVIAAEDRRHMQSFVPLLILTYRAREGRAQGLEMVVRNIGFGIATDISVNFKGAAHRVEFPVLALRDEKVVNAPQGSEPGGHINVIYWDMFMNQYYTHYPSSGNLTKYEWHQPDELRPPITYRFDLDA